MDPKHAGCTLGSSFAKIKSQSHGACQWASEQVAIVDRRCTAPAPPHLFGSVRFFERAGHTVTYFRNLRRPEIILIVLAVLALLALIFFDTGPPLAFNDDWVYAWGARHFSWSRIRIYPAASALALPQITVVGSLGFHDQRLLRLSLVIFVALAGLAAYRISRTLGADRFWSGLAPVAPVAYPVFMSNATSFMSDIPAASLLLLFTWATLVWSRQQTRSAAIGMILFAFLLPLQRQSLAAAPLAAASLMALSRGHEVGGHLAKRLPLMALLLVTVASLTLPITLHLSPPTVASRVNYIHHGWRLIPFVFGGLILFAPSTCGFVLAPFIAGELTATQNLHLLSHHRVNSVLAVGAICAFAWAFNGGTLLEGNQVTNVAFGVTILPGLKPSIFPDWATAAMGLIAALSACSFAWSLGTIKQHVPGAGLLVVLSLAAIVPYGFAAYLPLDRYYVPSALLLVPIAATVATRSPRANLSRYVALGTLALGICVYVIGEQDYQAWSAARDDAARLAYKTYSPYQVNAGYEANAVYGELPYYDRTGVALSDLANPNAYDFSKLGPRHPAVELASAGAGVAGEGISYRSLAPGRIVLRSMNEPFAAGPYDT